MGLRIENLNKSYGDFKALKNISFEAESGQILGILSRYIEMYRNQRERVLGLI